MKNPDKNFPATVFCLSKIESSFREWIYKSNSK